MILASVLFTLPTTTDIIADIGAWSEPIFDEFYPFIVAFLGLAFVGIVFKIVSNWGK